MTIFTMGTLEVTAYGLCLAAAALLGTAAFACFARREGCPRTSWRVLAPLAVAAAYLGARLYYILATGVHSGMFDWVLFVPYPFMYAMCGAVIGVMLACLLTARLTRQPSARLADALAPAGMATLALARCGEVFSDFGWGLVISEGPMFFPLAVQDMYGQWHGAIFFLEAVCALAVLVYALRVKTNRPGQRFALTLTLWSLTQVFCESFRAETLRWGFVRVQQVQCAVFALVVLAVYTCRIAGKDRALLARWGAFVLGVGLVALMEYALDKLPLPHAVDYTIMALALGAMFMAVRSVVCRACTGKWKQNA